APALSTLSPSSATPSQRQWVSAATSANDSFEIRPAPKPDMGRIPDGDLQARALASLRVNSRNSFVVIPKRKTSGAPPGEGRRSVAPPEEEGWASQHPEPEAQLVPGVNGVFAGERSPSRIEEGGSPAPTTALVDPAVRWQRPPSPPPSPRAAAEAEPAQGFQTPGLAKNGREPGRPGLPITFIDEVDSEDEVPQEAKLPCSGVGAPPQYHPHPTRPGHLSELQRRGGNTFTVVPKRKPGAVQANGEARPREAEEEEPGRVSEPSAAAGTSLKKRYPTVHEIEVIGGYLALQKSCLTKAGSSRKKVSGQAAESPAGRGRGGRSQICGCSMWPVLRTPGLGVGWRLRGPEGAGGCARSRRVWAGGVPGTGSSGILGTQGLSTLRGWWGWWV
ncbi:PREDICTED: taperin, partial [Bison bison bison]|uniref:Taperin n=1 Tax=Bison bison bison TaxID=43346 RepID=A0A6P3HKN3_BISBB